MTFFREHRTAGELNELLRDAQVVTPALMAEIIGVTCRRYPPVRRTERSARIERLIESEAWLDAALALIDLELPQWQLRRIAYDEGEWHCALSRQRELPDWLDQSIEAHHEDLPLAILSAFVEGRCIGTVASRPSVPTVPRGTDRICVPVCCDNFA
jgi:hypothetical protein